MELNRHVPIASGIPSCVKQLCGINRLEQLSNRINEDVGNDVVVLYKALGADGGINFSILDESLKNL